MKHSHYSTNRTGRTRVAVTFLIALMSLTLLATPVAAQEESPAPSPSVAESACDSADDLRVIIGFIQESVEDESGLIPVGIGVIAAVSEAQTLVDLVGQTFRPLVEDLVASLQDLRDTIGALEDLETVGSKLALVGVAVTDIGIAMDSLSVQLQTDCTDE